MAYDELENLTDKELIQEFEKTNQNLGRTGRGKTDFMRQRFIKIVGLIKNRGLNVETFEEENSKKLKFKDEQHLVIPSHNFSKIYQNTTIEHSIVVSQPITELPSNEEAILANCTTKILLKNEE